MDISTEQHKAAGEIVELIIAKMGSNRQIHPATSIAAGARLAGSFLFRSFNFNLGDIKPGNVVLSEQANEKGPVLINVLGGTLASFGVNVDPNKATSSVHVQPNISFLDTLSMLQRDAFDIMTANQLNPEQMAHACAMATAYIIKESQNDLSAEQGFHAAIYGFIEGSKTCPPELDNSKPLKKSIFTFWK